VIFWQIGKAGDAAATISFAGRALARTTGTTLTAAGIGQSAFAVGHGNRNHRWLHPIHEISERWAKLGLTAGAFELGESELRGGQSTNGGGCQYGNGNGAAEDGSVEGGHFA
jgi:hypothetical protein